MPQIISTMNNCKPREKISLHAKLLDTSFTIHQRACRKNQTEREHLERQMRAIDRLAAFTENRRKLLLQRTTRSLRQINAYRSVLQTNFRCQHFDTLRPGYTYGAAPKDPQTNQRYAYEMKIYNSGFSMKNLRPFVERRIKEQEPMNVNKRARDRAIEICLNRNKPFLVDRTKPLTAILKEHRSHCHMSTAHVQQPLAGSRTCNTHDKL